MPLVSQLDAAEVLPCVPELAHPPLQPLQAGRRHFDLPRPVDPESQELPLPGPAHSGLVRVHLQPQMLRDPLRQVPNHPIRRGRSSHVDVTVVRVAHEAVPASLQFLVQRVQVDVRQQRRERPALRRPLSDFHYHAFHQSPATQVPANQFQHPFVPDDGPDSLHQDVVMHPVKELLDVQIDDPVPALPDHVITRRSHGFVSAASRSEPVAVFAEPRFEDRPQHLQQQLLEESIQHRRDPQTAHPTVRFRDFHPPHRGHRVGPVQQLGPDSRPVLLKVSLQVGGLHAVHPRRAPVAENRFQSRPVVVRRDHLFHQRLVPVRSFRGFAANGTRTPPFRLDGFHPWAFRAGSGGDPTVSRFRSSLRHH